MGGIIGLQGTQDAAQMIHVGLLTLQHRGQESSGIAVEKEDGDFFNYHMSDGLVMGKYTPAILETLKGTSAIGHVRYPTTGIKSGLTDAQPFLFKCAHGSIAIALSGNIVNTEALRAKLAKEGSIFQHSSETELIVHLIAREKLPIENALKKALNKIEGGYGGIMLFKGKLIAFRDPYGIRPLVLGKIGKNFMVASETSAIEVLGGKYIRDVEPAEILVIEKGKLSSGFFTQPKKENNCIFEQVYFSRPDSIVRGFSVAEARMSMGRKLAQQMKDIKADIVMPVPDSGFFAALGFAKESGIPFEMGLVRNHYMGRSFIKSTQHMREVVAKLKLFPIGGIVKGKNIILIDDSIVRGTTAKKMINMLKEHGVKNIHFAVTSPPIIAPCFYGINTPSKSELIYCNMSHEQIVKEIGVTSLHLITIKNAADACGGISGCQGFCSACFTDKYPTKISKSTREAR
ncbi:Amidophosphoribosyltransferase [Elusimicrobium minutum Pei191]|uniref:Amidophosphoribosyltransferase n=1 Tax=Elusimicrobium minutum (strain Pei191) TaxID=445932 RepID=B2KCF2_ELUMP|nr:amidophosphoribosyltransferase [Elusimicrobium minutum]ACC98073.1 Amidophosphoribosyltransferase [Elusimicrobium minutum Pei191]